FCPGWIFPMSASLTDALICGVFKSFNVINPLELELEEDDDDDVDEELDPVGPPLIHCPTAPLSPAMVPPAGATSVAAARFLLAVCSAARAFATCALAASTSACVGGASVCAAVAICVWSAA